MCGLNWSVDDLVTLLVRESRTDVAVFHPLAISSFKDGCVSVAKAAEALEKYPNRFIGAYMVVDPLTGPHALESMTEQKDLFGDKTLGLKLYPTSWQGHKPVSSAVDDPTLIYPLYERRRSSASARWPCRRPSRSGRSPWAGRTTRATSRTPRRVPRPQLRGRARRAGLPGGDGLAAPRFGNISVNMEIQNIIVERRPNSFADILIGLCRIGGNAVLDRLF